MNLVNNSLNFQKKFLNQFICIIQLDSTQNISTVVELPLSQLNDNLIIDWGDSTYQKVNRFVTNSLPIQHTYSTFSDYTIKITGSFTFEQLNKQYKNFIITKIINWGEFQFEKPFVFRNCNNLTISAIDTPKILTKSLQSTFQNCESLTSLDVSKWNVQGVENFDAMFSYCYGITNLNISNWNMSNATSIRHTFNSCLNLSYLNVTYWNVSNLVSALGSFRNAEKINNLDVSNWNTISLQNISGMFAFTNISNLDIRNWNVTSLINANFFLWRSFGLSQSYFQQVLVNWNLQNVNNDVNISFGTSVYLESTRFGNLTTYANAHSELINHHNWTIINGFPITDESIELPQ
jgi:surface protein